MQSASWTLHERVSFDRSRVTSLDWETYPILRFSEVPAIETVLLDRPGAPFLGAGRPPRARLRRPSPTPSARLPGAPARPADHARAVAPCGR